MATTESLPTAAIADAAVRLGLPVRAAPASLVPLIPGAIFDGPARPVTHLGSVDVFLDRIDGSPAGSVLVIDNGGRHDEACVGDLMLLEAKLAGLAGLVAWGRHRDTAQLRRIGLPIHSLGAFSFGPRRVPPGGPTMTSAFLDGVSVTDGDHVFADDDGVLFAGPEGRDELVAVARAIHTTETAQAERMREGRSLREQLDFAGYRARQATEPSLTLRQYLIERGGAVET